MTGPLHYNGPGRPEVAEPGAWSFPPAERRTLSTGLDVLVYRLPGQYVVSAGLVLDTPLNLEARDREGVAELTAGTLDQGTASHPGTAFAEAVEDCGAALEASVGYSSTRLYLDVPASRLGRALPLLAEAVREPTLTDADVERERAIRLADLEQQLAHGASRAELALRRAVIAPEHRAARSTSGEPDTLARVTGADARAFHARHYGPRGATLVLAGDLPGDPLALAEEIFGGWTNPGQAAAPHDVPRPRERRLFLVDRPGSVQADVRLARFTIDRRDPRWADLQIATYSLGGAFLSRLNGVLREEKGYTYGVHCATTPLRDGGLTTVSGSFRTEVVADAVALVPRLLDVAERPLDAAEVRRARTYLLGVQPLQYATASGVCNGALSLLAAGLSTSFVDNLRDALRAVTPASASAAATELLPPDELTLVVVGDAAALAPALADRGFAVEVLPPDGQP